MELRTLAVVLPCDGLGDFPTFLTATDAERALHNWTGAWHPALIAAAGAPPAVWSAFSPPPAESAAGALVLAPTLGAMPDLTDWREEASAEAQPPPLVFEGLAHRDAIIAASRDAGADVPKASHNFAPDFYALGYAYLQTELLTQSLQYASIIEPEQLRERIVEAARAAVAGDAQGVDDALRRVYDLLEQARDHTYPVELCLIDAVLVGETTLGARLERELAEPTPKCYLVSPEVAEQIARGPAATRERMATAEIVLAEPPDAGLDTTPPEPMRRRVLDGYRRLQRALGTEMHWYAHASSDLPPRLPTVLQEAGCRGALLTPLDGGAAPGADQPRCLWTGVDGAAVQALAVPPRDASSADTLLLHAQRLGDSLYSDRVSTVVMAAWAGRRHELYDDLRRLARRSRVLGRFVSLEEYFGATEGAGAEARFDRAHAPRARPRAPHRTQSARLVEHYKQLLGGLTHLARLSGGTPGEDGPVTGADIIEATCGLADAVARSGDREGGGVLVANAWSYPRPVLLSPPNGAGEPCDLLTTRLIPTVPGAGFRVAPREDASVKSADAPPRAAGAEAQNELLIAAFDTETGGVRSLRRQERRANRLSQKLVAINPRRHVETPTEARGVTVETLLDAPDRGAVAARGELVDASGRTLIQFRQTLVLFAQWDRVFLDVELDTSACEAPPMGPPRFASRIAWPDEECRLFRGVQWARVPAEGRWLSSPEYVHLEVGRGAVTIADTTEGLRRRVGPRMLDTLLPHPPGGVSRHRFVFALDERRPLRAALDLAAQTMPAAVAPCGGAPTEGWLAHVDTANVLITAIEPAAGGEPGVRVRLMETEGRPADARLSFARRPARAHALDDQGRRAEALDLEGGAVLAPLAAYEWRGVEVTW